MPQFGPHRVTRFYTESASVVTEADCTQFGPHHVTRLYTTSATLCGTFRRALVWIPPRDPVIHHLRTPPHWLHRRYPALAASLALPPSHRRPPSRVDPCVPERRRARMRPPSTPSRGCHRPGHSSRAPRVAFTRRVRGRSVRSPFHPASAPEDERVTAIKILPSGPVTLRTARRPSPSGASGRSPPAIRSGRRLSRRNPGRRA